MELDKFSKLLKILFYCYRLELSEEMTMAWYWILKEYSREAMEYSIKETIKVGYDRHEINVSIIERSCRNYYKMLELEESRNVHKLSK